MADRITTSESPGSHPQSQQPARGQREREGTESTPLFNAGKLDAIKKSLEGIQEQSREIPNSDELAQFLFHVVQASGALEALRIAEVEKASKSDED